MTDRAKPFEMATVVERTARTERLDAAFAVLVDPQRDPDSISLAARLAGGEVLSLSDLPAQPAFFDPLAFSAASPTNDQNKDSTP